MFDWDNWPEDSTEEIAGILEELTDGVEIDKTERILTSGQKLSDKIKSLPLSVDDNNKLIQAILEHMEISMQEAFIQGFKAALKAAAKEWKQ